MAKKYNNLCQTQDRLSKKSLLAYLGIYDINENRSDFDIVFDENFNNPCVDKKSNKNSSSCNNTANFNNDFNDSFASACVNKQSNKNISSGRNNLQNLFYRMCLESWDINSYNSSTGEVCVVLYNPHGNTLISFNLNKTP